VVRIANQFRVPIYPISSGKNWGYGSRAQAGDGVLLNLSRLNRILAFDEELAYVTIEPGVTQHDLYTFLQERRSRLWMDATGASPDCSIIGNTLERGFGHTPMGDHCSHASAFEVVLPSGACIETGFGRFAGADAAALSHWGIGPALDGLFAQSNLGIVTRMTVHLMPRPEHFQAFFFTCHDEPQLAGVVDALRPLRLGGTLRSVIHIGNDYKVLAGTSQYPWSDTNGEVPLGSSAMATIRQRLRMGAWSGGGGLYGSPSQVRDARRQVRQALAGKVDKLQFVDDRLFRLIHRYGKIVGWVTGWDLTRALALLGPVYNLMQGVPTASTLGSTYWRKRIPVPANPDPDRDRCGLLWCSPVFPSTGAHALAVSRLASRIVLEHGFEPQMSISLETERSAICVTTISYDRAVDGEDDRAMACYRHLTESLLAAGYPPYRLNVASMAYAHPDRGYEQLLQHLKATLDPNGILAPGRYAAAVAQG
jgi:4-cresol dehydrogenase (hydroxylating)